MSTNFEEYLSSEGICHESTVPKIPERNGVAERMNRTLVETLRSMLADAKLLHSFWAEALSTAVYLNNRRPSKALKDMTLFEAWRNENQELSIYVCSAVMQTLICPRKIGKSWTQNQEIACFWVMEN